MTSRIFRILGLITLYAVAPLILLIRYVAEGMSYGLNRCDIRSADFCTEHHTGLYLILYLIIAFATPIVITIIQKRKETAQPSQPQYTSEYGQAATLSPPKIVPKKSRILPIVLISWPFIIFLTFSIIGNLPVTIGVDTPPTALGQFFINTVAVIIFATITLSFPSFVAGIILLIKRW